MKQAMASAAVLATLCCSTVGAASSAQAASTLTFNDRNTSLNRTLRNPTFEAARTSYGLAQEMKHGAILHAFMWSFNTIKQNMRSIAEAGYTAVQTPPVSQIVEPKTDVHGRKHFTENWYYVYQPVNTDFGSQAVGTRQELQELTAEAHKYGVRVIVDAVVNHFTSDWKAIDGSWRSLDNFHYYPDKCIGEMDYNNRWNVTHCPVLGLWDLYTEKQPVADRMARFLDAAVNDGADGMRYDAPKSIELPYEFKGQYSNYWVTILQNGAQFQYGEVIQAPDAGLDVPAYVRLFDQYSSNGGATTPTDYGMNLRNMLAKNDLNHNEIQSYRINDVRDDQLVTWVESHDNYATTWFDSSAYLNAWQIRMGWGVIGARAGGAPLFLNRPAGSGGQGNPVFAEISQLGDTGDEEWRSPEVVAVNHFRNAMENNAEELRNCGSNQCLMVERYQQGGSSFTDGVAITNMGSDVDLSNTETQLADGEYIDQVNGGMLTVKHHVITSGTAHGGKISVFFNRLPNKHGVAYIASNGTAFKTNTTQVTLHADSVADARYTTSEGDSGTFTDGQTVTIGARTGYEQYITVTVTGRSAVDNTPITYTVRMFKQDPSIVSTYRAYAKQSAKWPNTYAYVYVDSKGATPKVIENAPWPGVLMTHKPGTCDGNADYVYEVPPEILKQSGSYPIRVIFNNGGPGYVHGNKFPPDDMAATQNAHVDKEGLLIDGDYLWDGKITPSSQSWTIAPCKPM
ncbi:alpha-amylase family glycosyl hydrolase [Bifidobacterium dolichotidis]|uniref:alpha-amylase family glycosyl hydrolase n=1 Tax=Bifidobacterium dolichotidis TaxID=2306976 RepID=UPI0013DDAD7B|nr:alpha-amylase family glycosyl hydrolase [Bifidobacterium dolichotidis]